MRWSSLHLPPELRPDWLKAQPVRLPGRWSEPPRAAACGSSVSFNFDVDAAMACLAEERWVAPTPSPTTWVPFTYLAIPGPLRRLAATLLYLRQRWLRPRRDPAWPVAPTLDVLLELAGRRHVPHWGARWAAALTHDVDTVLGLRRASAVADIVEQSGYRACFFVVGTALQQEPGIARELHARGHEIGSHDFVHDNRLYQLPVAEQGDRLRRAFSSIEPYRGCGFRAPSLRRTAELIHRIGKIFAYDSSVCDTDLEQRRGCTTVLPYDLRGCLEIPVTLPPDASLMYAGYGPAAMLRIWQQKCAYVRASRGVAVLVTHTEPHLASQRRLQSLRRFLAWLEEQQDVVVLRPAEIAVTVRRGTVPRFAEGSRGGPIG